ncbi:hypothetical protein [Burkholderia gladioli]|uniref:hypothetical protein n=1 Tax=Burkholderia gladioli TaxID=28095 RepID=UPI003132FBD6
MIPKAHQPPGKRYMTVNARSETVGEKPAFRAAWREPDGGESIAMAMHRERRRAPRHETRAPTWRRESVDRDPQLGRSG